jgi:hypothetical protein
MDETKTLIQELKKLTILLESIQSKYPGIASMPGQYVKVFPH